MPQKTMDDVIRANTERQRYSIAVLDIETTGLDKKLDYILEIGICELNLLTGTRKKLFDQIVRESGFSEKHRNAWIFDNSTLSFDQVIKSPLITEIQAPLQLSTLKFFIITSNTVADQVRKLANESRKARFQH